MSTPIATPSDLATRLGQTVDTNRAAAIILDAQTLAEMLVSPLPAEAQPIVLNMALRAYVNPQQAQSETVGGVYQVNRGPNVGVYMTKNERAALKRMAGRSSGAFTADPTPAGAGTGMPPWDVNVTWLEGVPTVDQQTLE